MARLDEVYSDRERMMTDMTRELEDEQRENDALRMELKELKEELDEIRRRRDGAIDDTRWVFEQFHHYHVISCHLLGPSTPVTVSRMPFEICHMLVGCP